MFFKKKLYWSRVRSNGIIPTKRKGDGCYDVYLDSTLEDKMIKPGEIVLLPTAIASAFSSKYRIGLRERGSTGSLGLSVRAGQIDSNYRGEWFIAINNTSNKTVIITSDPLEVDSKKYTPYPLYKAVCQAALEIVPIVKEEEITWEELQSLETERGNGCLGSSKK